MKIDRTGEICENHFGTQMEIVAYRKSEDIDVQFLDNYGYIAKNYTYNNFIKGSIRNPFDRTAHKMGYLGVGPFPRIEDGKLNRCYNVWESMLGRCYRYDKKYPAYYGIVSMCDKWLCYQTFAEWYYANEYAIEERLHVDKDILHPGNKIYAPEHCILVPQRINALFLNKSNQGLLPNGIRKARAGYVAMYNLKNLGTYSNLEDAFKAHSAAKIAAVQCSANEYRDLLPSNMYDALMNYAPILNADKNYQKI